MRVPGTNECKCWKWITSKLLSFLSAYIAIRIMQLLDFVRENFVAKKCIDKDLNVSLRSQQMIIGHVGTNLSAAMLLESEVDGACLVMRQQRK